MPWTNKNNPLFHAWYFREIGTHLPFFLPASTHSLKPAQQSAQWLAAILPHNMVTPKHDWGNLR